MWRGHADLAPRAQPLDPFLHERLTPLSRHTRSGLVQQLHFVHLLPAPRELVSVLAPVVLELLVVRLGCAGKPLIEIAGDPEIVPHPLRDEDRIRAEALQRLLVLGA